MGSLANAPTEEFVHTLSADEQLALIQRIAFSEQFRRSARLRDFLVYVGNQSLAGASAEIHEHEIGVKVFGRPTSYNRSDDNIVRVNAGELRKRLQLYFENEGAQEPWLVEIPRGGYTPIYRRRVLSPPLDLGVHNDFAAGPMLDVDSVLSEPSEVSAKPQLVWQISTCLLAATCVALLVLHFVQPSHSRTRPNVLAFWKEFLQSHSEIDVVLPDASVSLAEEMVGHPLTLTDYLNHNYRSSQVQDSALSADRQRDLETLYQHNLVAFGDFRAAQQIQELSSDDIPMHLTLSRFYSADLIKRNSVVLIGGEKSNPWVRLYDDKLNFSLEYDNKTSRSFIVNRHPQTGEQATYSPSPDPSSLVGYSVIGYLPNLSNSGDVIVIAGTGSDETSAAAEFLTSEKQFTKFRKLAKERYAPYFEVLLKNIKLGGTNFTPEIVAYRFYSRPPK